MMLKTLQACTMVLLIGLLGTSRDAAAADKAPFLQDCRSPKSEFRCLEAIYSLNSFFLDSAQIKVVRELLKTSESEKIKKACHDIIVGEGTPQTRWIDEQAEHKARHEHSKILDEERLIWYHRLDRVERLDPRTLSEADRLHLISVAWSDPDWRVRMAAHTLLLGGATNPMKDAFRRRNRTWQQKLKDGLRSCVDLLIR